MTARVAAKAMHLAPAMAAIYYNNSYTNGAWSLKSFVM
jgi:hypothetical protein